MIRTTAGKIAAELVRRGIGPDERVTVTVELLEESQPERPKLAEIAARMRATAVARGLTTEIFDALLEKS